MLQISGLSAASSPAPMPPFREQEVGSEKAPWDSDFQASCLTRLRMPQVPNRTHPHLNPNPSCAVTLAVHLPFLPVLIPVCAQTRNSRFLHKAKLLLFGLLFFLT